MVKTRIIKVDPLSPNEKDIEFAATLLKDGGLVAFPTETVYGIGANYLKKEAIERLYKVKKRPKNKPFTIHIATIDTVKEMGCEIPNIGELLIKEFWPGPLTLILKSKNGKLGFRMPKNTIAKSLISKSGVPIVAPSANLFGKKPAVEAGEILQDLGNDLDLILDAGKTDMQKESTIVDMTTFSPKILREGAILKEVIGRVTSSG